MVGDAEAFRDVVLWARRTGVVLASLSVGSVQAHLTDPHAMRLPEAQPGDVESALETYGGAGLAKAIREFVPVDRSDES